MTSLAMINSNNLCNVCSEILDSPLSQDWIEGYHRNFKSFEEALINGCFICTTVWKNFYREYRTSLTGSSGEWQPTKYRVYKEESETDLVKLEILYHDPILDQTLDIRFRLISEYGHEFRANFPFANLEPSTSSATSLDLILKWHFSCKIEHVKCNRLMEKQNFNPTRLLDIGAKDEASWRLYPPLDKEVLSTAYMTLSYRWSWKPALMLLQSNMEELRNGKLIRNLPLTFRDLVEIARRFSVRYVWIDALCIIQDSEKDWELESSKMRQVYANSCCNIAATASVNPEGGLFRARDPKSIRPGVVRASFSGSDSQHYYIFDKSYSQRQLFDGPLHRRGWVFQERLLAPRVIHFAEDQIFWECFTEHKCEGFPHGIPFHSPLKDFDLILSVQKKSEVLYVGIFNLWNNLVQEYTKCSLTKQDDKLIALSGLARIFHEATGDEYIAGLWKSHLASQLDWRVYQPRDKSELGYRAPSWSWACLDGPVIPTGQNPSTIKEISIIDVQIQRSSPDLFGKVVGGHIILNGIIARATCRNTEKAYLYQLKSRTSTMNVQLYPDTKGVEFNGKELYCLVVKTERVHSYVSRAEPPEEKRAVTFLILEYLESAPDTYKRIGHFVLYDEEPIQKFDIQFASNGSILMGNKVQRSLIKLV